MKKLNRRIVRWLLLLAVLGVSMLPQILGQTRHGRRHTPAATMAASTQHPKFQLDCTLPALTSQPLAIDKKCGREGDSSGESAKQNEVKNRFCLPGAPTEPSKLEFTTFDTLQQTAEQHHIPFGRKTLPDGTSQEQLPPDRSLLVDLITGGQGQSLGEGSLVTLEGFVFKAQHSNVSSGESVSCHTKGLMGNDIHIALAETKVGAKAATHGTKNEIEAAECETVTAEITPHHRSAIYNRFDTNPADFLNGAAQKPKKDKLKGHPLPLQSARVRMTGQLFFDGSHSPCINGHGGPPRRSIWEIHPVFAIEVFETTQNKFIPFEEWAQLHSH